MNTTPANDTRFAPPPASAITVWEIRGKDRKLHGHAYPGAVVAGHHAQIVPGVSLRLFGIVKAGSRWVKGENGRMVACEEHTFIRDFRIGDEAVVGSYNLTYTGIVRGISEKTITVVEYEGTSSEKVHRMDLATFDGRNWNYDAEETSRRNSETMQCI